MAISKWVVFVGAAAICCVLGAQGQDPPSLGDVARQSRQQKQQQDAQSSQNSPSDSSQGQQTAGNPPAANPAKSTHVITNDELPEHTSKPSPIQPSSSSAPGAREVKHPAEYFRTLALQLKTAIVSLQKRIDIVTHSIYYAGGNYETNTVWNERQRQKQLQVESMKGQLADLQNRLETLQETARRQGYGNSVYDP